VVVVVVAAAVAAAVAVAVAVVDISSHFWLQRLKLLPQYYSPLFMTSFLSFSLH
jgi:hypothetical protein